jgi:L-idonate 5-dehydrogenase
MRKTRTPPDTASDPASDLRSDTPDSVGAAAAKDARVAAPASPAASPAPAARGFSDVLRLLPSPEPGDVALSLEAAGLMANPDAPDGPPIFAPGEASGRIEAVGPGVTHLFPGQRVAIAARGPCGACSPCLSGAPGFCASPVVVALHAIGADGAPPLRGMTIAAARCTALPGVAPAAAALLAPFAAALHAVERSGPALGRRALVCGANLDGALLVAALRMAGAAEVVALGVGGGALDRMTAAGADAVIDAGAENAAAAALRGGARFDICIDATGAAAVLAIAAEALRPLGILTLTRGGDAAGPVARLAAKEIELRGAARPLPDLTLAAALLRSGRASGLGALPDVFSADRIKEATARLRDPQIGVRVMLVWPGAERQPPISGPGD